MSRKVVAGVAITLLLAGCAGAGSHEDAREEASQAGSGATSGSGVESEAPDEQDANGVVTSDELDEVQVTWFGDARDDGGPDAAAIHTGSGPKSVAPAQGNALTLAAIRFGGTQCFNRVVLEYLGEGTPGWDVRYVDEARVIDPAMPSAERIGALDVDGERILAATITGVGGVSGDEWRLADAAGGPQTVTAPVTTIIREVRYTGFYDGGHQFLIGLDTPRSLPETNAYVLTDPVRVVIEVLECG